MARYCDCAPTLASLVVREIDFSEILDSVEIVDDPEWRNPFTDTDCFPHTLEKFPASTCAHASRHIHGNWQTICVSDDDYGFANAARELGASRQVAAEYAARCLADVVDEIARIYSGEWASYGVRGEFEGAEASVWGCDGFGDSAHWDYLEETRREIAREIAHELEQTGRWRVVNTSQDWRERYNPARGHHDYCQRMARRLNGAE